MNFKYEIEGIDILRKMHFRVFAEAAIKFEERLRSEFANELNEICFLVYNLPPHDCPFVFDPIEIKCIIHPKVKDYAIPYLCRLYFKQRSGEMFVEVNGFEFHGPDIGEGLLGQIINNLQRSLKNVPVGR